MPIRRLINSSPATTANSPASRLRSDLSQDGSVYEFGMYQQKPAEGPLGEQRVISALVGRIINKVSCLRQRDHRKMC